jgi:hypothetical protein
MLRAVRISAIAVVLPILFTISQRVSAARGDEPLPGMSAALGVLATLFGVRALVTEHAPEAAPAQKDLLWGLAAGAFVTIITRWLV